jgi:hypothetical protein
VILLSYCKLEIFLYTFVIRNQVPSPVVSHSTKDYWKYLTVYNLEGEIILFKKRRVRKESVEEPTNTEPLIQDWPTVLSDFFHGSPDLIFKKVIKGDSTYQLFYLQNVVDNQKLQQSILPSIQSLTNEQIGNDVLMEHLPVGVLKKSHLIEEIGEALISGYVFIVLDQESIGLLCDISDPLSRALSSAEMESLVFGPRLSFTESLSTNIGLIRKHTNDKNFCAEPIIVGERNKTEIRLLYIKELTDETNVQTLRQRITDLEIDDVIDSNVLSQLLDDQSLSLFPQMLTTELPDRVSHMLLKGKVAILVDRSPYALIGPATFLNFFESTDDIYSRWNLGMLLRWLRFISVILATLLTPLYVATVTFHYQVIPVPLLASIGQSRSNVPFPPVMEALILEFILELLKEAGARLPTKVGQTMGIVGGIVIGQAAVEAGFTSNILIILVALSALGTFTSPSYIMGTAFRFVRYPLIIVAGAWGGIGLMFGLIILILHLLKLTSMGRPYFAPIFPFRMQDLKDSVFRFPFTYNSKRPITNRPQDSNRFPSLKGKAKKDIDE